VLLPFKSIRNSNWLHWPLIGLHIFNFSRTAVGIYSKLSPNGPYNVSTTIYYCLSRPEIQYGRPDYSELGTYAPFESRPSVATFEVDPKSNIAVLVDKFLTSSQE